MASGYALFDGTAGSKIETPDHASLDIVNAIDIRLLVAPDVWDTGANDYALLSKLTGYDELTQSYQAYIASGEIALTWWDSVEGRVTETSGVVAPGVDGEHLWLRATFIGDNGSGEALVRFYTSAQTIETDPTSIVWTQLGVDVVKETVHSINVTTLPVTLGAAAGDIFTFDGKFYYAEIRDGIGGTIVADVDFRDADQKTGELTFTDTTGRVWTFDTAVWVPSTGVGGGGRRKTRPPRNPRRYQV